jgi:HPt (histidine-containing phosphotransfer) domain-containing protein
MTSPGPDTLLDPAAFQRLREWGGDALLGKIVALFLEHAPTRLEEVEEGAVTADLQRIERGAHALKSSAANVGGVALQDLASRLEAAAESGDWSQVNTLLPPFRSCFQGTLRELRGSGVAAPTESTAPTDAARPTDSEEHGK